MWILLLTTRHDTTRHDKTDRSKDQSICVEMWVVEEQQMSCHVAHVWQWAVVYVARSQWRPLSMIHRNVKLSSTLLLLHRANTQWKTSITWLHQQNCFTIDIPAHKLISKMVLSFSKEKTQQIGESLDADKRKPATM